MPRCQDHQDLDRYTKDMEKWGPLHPLGKQAERRNKAVLMKMEHRGHAFGYDCPDEEDADA